jgi:hypothetical protein
MSSDRFYLKTNESNTHNSHHNLSALLAAEVKVPNHTHPRNTRQVFGCCSTLIVLNIQSISLINRLKATPLVTDPRSL